MSNELINNNIYKVNSTCTNHKIILVMLSKGKIKNKISFLIKNTKISKNYIIQLKSKDKKL